MIGLFKYYLYALSAIYQLVCECNASTW